MTENEELKCYKQYYLADAAVSDRIKKDFRRQHTRVEERWTEVFYDTPNSDLSKAECILKTDTTAPQFWKFFCYAKGNIMEITTDEKNIQQPLSRMMDFPKAYSDIKNASIKPFFEIRNQTDVFSVEDCNVYLTETDFGFGFCVVEYTCLGKHRILSALEKIETVATILGLKQLSSYDPDAFM